MKRLCCWSFALLLLIPFVGQAQEFKIAIENGDRDFAISPIRIPLQWPKDRELPQLLQWNARWALLTEPNFVTEKIKAENGKIRKDLILLTRLDAGKKAEYPLIGYSPGKERGSVAIPRSSLSWKDQPNEFLDLIDSATSGKSTPIMRYMYKTYDTTTPAVRNKTYKVFHHVFDPSGEGRIVTNGGHTDDFKNEKDLLYPHHRGLMFAFNKCQYDGKSVDTWHCTNGAHISHQKTIFQTAGPNSAEHRVLLTWHGPKDEVFAEEERQMTAYKVPEDSVIVKGPSGAEVVKVPSGTLIEFATRLTPKVAKLRLDGDPQHSGFQFRAHNDVAKKSAKETYYLRPDGKGKPGATRNWEPKKGGPVNLPWDVMSFVLDGKRYSVAYIDHPSNPGEKRYSERDYGRFGCYFEADLTPENPLILNHRVWLQEGEMTAEQVENLRQAFVDPPRVTVK
jgi:hypothetical protein